mmetsp:Transcript_6252/g.22220  ORF Transcript_6252/g.22220 Transcript_6252/m.22220 type:complete len:107 (-) Transcript_6252:1180-1500(-)
MNPTDNAQKKSEKEKGCRCGRTKCLKQYCACFRNDVRCTNDCVCVDCHNDGKHEQARMMAVRLVRLNDPMVFLLCMVSRMLKCFCRPSRAQAWSLRTRRFTLPMER